MDSNEILIKSGRIVNEDRSFISDILIKDGKIIDIGENIESKENFKTLDAKDHYVIPGGIDLNTHFEARSSIDDLKTGCLAALHGGTTTIVDNIEAGEDESLSAAYERIASSCDCKVHCNVAFKLVINKWSFQVGQEMVSLCKEKGIGIISLMAGLLSDDEFQSLLEKCKEAGLLLYISGCVSTLYDIMEKEMLKEEITGPEGYLYSHPEEIETSLIGKAIMMANNVGVAVYIGGVTSAKTADIIATLRKQGVVVFGGTTGAALCIDGSAIFHENWATAASVLTDPPLRPGSKNISTLINYLASGSLQGVASNHASYKVEQKAVGKDDFRKIARGMSGAQERMSIVWEKLFMTGKIDASQFVALTSSNAAKLLNIYPNKGKIAVGSDADLVLWSAGKGDGKKISLTDADVYKDVLETTHHALTVIVAGRIQMSDFTECESTCEKNILFATSFCDYAYGRLLLRDKIKPACIVREPFELPLNDGKLTERELNANNLAAKQSALEPFCRPPTRSGGRNMQDTTFSLCIDPTKVYPIEPITSKKGSGYRVNQPPGGQTSTLW